MLQVNPFENFPARSYLETYYSYVGGENETMMRALAHFARRFEPRFEQVVEVGGGPSVVPILALCATIARSPRSITFTDISLANLAEVERWLYSSPTGFSYACVLKWLSREHGIEATQIEQLARAGEWTLSSIDLEEPLPTRMAHAFDTVSSHFFAESATSDQKTLISLLRRIAGLGAPDARVFLSFMRRSIGYSVDGIDFPAIPVDEDTLPGLLRAADLHLIEIEYLVADVETPPTRPGYEGMVFVGGVLRD